MKRARRSPSGRDLSPLGQAVVRQRWRDLLALALARAGDELQGEADPLAVQFFAGELRRTASNNQLPLDQGVSAGMARTAFLAAAEGFLLAEGERRARFAWVLLMAANLVEHLFDSQQLADAATWQRQFKED